MKGKSGNLIMVLRVGESVYLDGPGRIVVKKTSKTRTVILVDADDETNIKKESDNKDVVGRQLERGQDLGPSLL